MTKSNIYAMPITLLSIMSLPWLLLAFNLLQYSDLSTISSLGNLLAIIILALFIFVFTKEKNIAYRIGASISTIAFGLLYWIIPAVGIFGVDGHSMDLWFAPLFPLTIITASFFGYKSQYLRNILVVIAFAQLVIGLYFIQVQLGLPEQYESDRIVQIFFMNGFFAGLYTLAAMYFHEAYQLENAQTVIKIHLTDFIHLKSLIARLQKDELSSLEEMLFLLANWSVFGFLSFIFVNQQYDNPGVILMLTALPIIGLFISYRSNAKGDGKDFLKRLIPLHFNLGLRFMVLSIISLIISAQIGQVIDHPAIKGFFIGGIFFAVILGFYISLGRSISKISTIKTPQ